MNDTRAKLEELFRRLSDPALSDIEAMEACLWFRKLRLDAKDVSNALGLSAPDPSPVPLMQEYEGGPMWPFKKKHAGEPIAYIARTDPDYLRYFLGLQGEKALREPLKSQVRAALGMPPEKPKPVSQDFENP